MFECYTDEYYNWSYMFVIPMILIVAFFIPLFLGLYIYKTSKSMINRKKFLLMTGEYKNNSWYWEFIKMYTKIGLMCILTFFEYDIPNKVINIIRIYMYLNHLARTQKKLNLFFLRYYAKITDLLISLIHL